VAKIFKIAGIKQKKIRRRRNEIIAYLKYKRGFI